MRSCSYVLVLALLLSACSEGNAPRGRTDAGLDAAETPADGGRTGECITNADCDDGDSCTTNLCDAVNGECGYRAIADCCAAAADCDDANTCTTDSCDGDACAHAPVAGCCRADADCDDGDACTTDSCDVATNSCGTTPVPDCCADGATRACYEGPAGTVD
ncbi:MAG: hypothetical protein M3Y87_29080, partial [Myxococcota bacterium]|nr:hypothetical protein [Myxococcota bacterium]